MASVNSLNRVVLLGNLGDDPEVKQAENGSLVVSFNLATNFSFTNKSGKRVSQTDWHRVVLFNSLADLGEKFLVKGKQVLVEGRLCSRTYEGKDGELKHVTRIHANTMILLGAGKNGDKKNLNPTDEDVKMADSNAVEDEPFDIDKYLE